MKIFMTTNNGGYIDMPNMNPFEMGFKIDEDPSKFIAGEMEGFFEALLFDEQKPNKELTSIKIFIIIRNDVYTHTLQVSNDINEANNIEIRAKIISQRLIPFISRVVRGETITKTVTVRTGLPPCGLKSMNCAREEALEFQAIRAIKFD